MPAGRSPTISAGIIRPERALWSSPDRQQRRGRLCRRAAFGQPRLRRAAAAGRRCQARAMPAGQRAMERAPPPTPGPRARRRRRYCGCAVRRRARPAGLRPGSRDDRGHQRQRFASGRGRSAKRHQRRQRRSDGRGGEGARDRHLFPPQARTFAAAGPAACGRAFARRYRDSAVGAGQDQAAGLRQ